MRRLEEGASLARDAGDSLWQARALESLLLCMAFLAWRGENSDIPDIVLKAYSTSQMLARSSTFPNRISLDAASTNEAVSNLTPARKWSKFAPAVARATISLYSSLESDTQAGIPVAIITESRIRLGNLLLFAASHGGTIDAGALEAFILAGKIASSPNQTVRRVTADPSLAMMMLDTLSAPVGQTSDSHILNAIAAVISSLSQIGSSRRHAFLFRSLLQTLVPILIRARKLGASEAGVHPSAALSATSSRSQGESQTLLGNFRALLESASHAYGIHAFNTDRPSTDLAASIEQMKANLKSWYLNQMSGDIALKLELLQLCVSASDALPDLKASLAYTSSTLKCGLRSLTISMTSVNPRPSLLPEEQTRLFEGLKRTVATAERLGLDDVQADYWDDFLVRDIYTYQAPDAAKLSSHKPSELSVVEEGKTDATRDPFIFNPFAKGSSAETTPVVVAGELMTFSVILQNPLEIEIDINNISLLTEGCDFQPTYHSILLGPFWSQAFSLTGTPQRSGELKVNGCRATISGCHEKDFPILIEDWQPPRRVKQKSASLHSGADLGDESAEITADLKMPANKSLSIKVIEPQPYLMIKSPSFPQPSVMLLEGEKKTFELVIRNETRSVPPDFLLFTFDDNVTTGLQEALGKKDMLPIDTYEVQYQLKNRPTVRMIAEDSGRLTSGAPSTDNTSYRFELFGRPGLTNAVVQMDFAHLGVPKSEITETFYTRQKRFPLAVTVNGSVDIPRCNVLPIQGDFPSIDRKDLSLNGSQQAVPAISEDNYCMLSLDLRNVWPHTLSVELVSKLKADEDGKAVDDPIYRVQEDLQPGHVTRVIVLVPRLFIQDPYAPIPNLITQRQYVVSASKLSLEAEAASRENFWYREELLKHISGTWKEAKTERQRSDRSSKRH